MSENGTRQLSPELLTELAGILELTEPGRVEALGRAVEEAIEAYETALAQKSPTDKQLRQNLDKLSKRISELIVEIDDLGVHERIRLQTAFDQVTGRRIASRDFAEAALRGGRSPDRAARR